MLFHCLISCCSEVMMLLYWIFGIHDICKMNIKMLLFNCAEIRISRFAGFWCMNSHCEAGQVVMIAAHDTQLHLIL